ncbi:unnamed protein product, partial [Cylicostephanus goldi]
MLLVLLKFDVLVNNYRVDEKITTYLNLLDIYVFPVLNPDGFIYSRSSTRATRCSRERYINPKNLGSTGQLVNNYR